jgi:hypothetical protein
MVLLPTDLWIAALSAMALHPQSALRRLVNSRAHRAIHIGLNLDPVANAREWRLDRAFVFGLADHVRRLLILAE